MSINQVPHDILSDILRNPKLSIEDIVRCAFVCKSWYSLVTSPTFISLHSTQPRFDSISKKKKGLFLVTDNDKKYSLNLDDDSLSEYKILEFPLKYRYNFRVVDCLNGVVCLSDDNDNIVLWNPSIRKLLELPKPLVPLDPYMFHSIGFGYNAATNDYKVVRALVSWWTKIYKAIEHHAEVYESSVGRWRRINKRGAIDWSMSCCASNQAFLNGVVHRVGVSLDEGIVSFDFRNEVFGRMDVPADLLPPHQYSKYGVRVSVIGGDSLSLLTSHKLHDAVVWVMKEYGVADSWAKLYTVTTSGTPGLQTWKIISTRWNGEPLVRKTGKPWLYSYVPDTKLVKRLELFRSYDPVVVNFTESLALLGVNGGNKKACKLRLNVEDQFL